MLKTIVRGTVAIILLATTAGSAVAEEVTRLAGRRGEPVLLVRHEPGPGPSVMFVHGATFPSSLSIAFPIEGRSWMGDLRERGFDVWAFDFAGYGGSGRPAAMANEDSEVFPIGRAADAIDQLERVALHIREVTGRDRVSILAHSWGTLPAGMFAARQPEMVDRLVLFGPVAARSGEASPPPAGGSYLVTTADQWRSFQAGLPRGQPPLISAKLFDSWASAYLATDPASGTRSPPAVLVPAGPQTDIADAWEGRFPYDPGAVRAPTLIVRGEWDAISTDADAAWLIKALSGIPGGARDLKLPRGGHRMHLEENRSVLFDAVANFLAEAFEDDDCRLPGCRHAM